MSSPLRRAAERISINSTLPEQNWLARRVDAIDSHAQSIENGHEALNTLAALVLQGRISTDLIIEKKQLEIDNLRPSDYLGHISYSVIPRHGAFRESIPQGLGQSWTPDVALQLTFAYQDRYDYTAPHTTPQPTGEVRLCVHARTWGRILEDEILEVNALGSGEDTWAEFGDQGHGRRGTHVCARRKPGEELSPHELETMLAPLASHVVNYFDLVGKPHLAQFQEPGNFSVRG